MAINWLYVLANVLWLGGTGLILAAFSYSDWFGQHQQQPLRQVLQSSKFQRVLSGGLSLVSLSLILFADTWVGAIDLVGFFDPFCLADVVRLSV